jgi:serine/threonine protein kinase
VCGKDRSVSGRQGSFTSYLFQDFRCRCKKNNASKDSGQRRFSAEHEARLSTQFYATPAGGLTDIRRQQARLARTEMVLKSSVSQAIDTLEPGEVIAGSYILEDKIAQGGMGMVFKARHRLLGRPCALKFLLPSVISPASWEMFKREAKILNELEHPAFCKIYDMGLHQGNLPFYAMEYLGGITLEELLNRQGTISLGAALEIFIEIGGALSYSHRQKIIHRDVKPANIMLVPGAGGTKDDGSVAVKLLDFGIAELCETVITPKEVIGSAGYMSPEQFGAQALTPATDIYSLACSLFEALSGRLPFEGLDFKELAIQHQQNEAPSLRAVTGCEFLEEIEAILHHALKKVPERRYRYMSEMVVDLERVVEEKPLQFARLNELDGFSLEPALAKSPKKKKVASGLWVGIGLAVAVVVAVGVLAVAAVAGLRTVGVVGSGQLRSPSAMTSGNLVDTLSTKAASSASPDDDTHVGQISSSLDNTVKGDDYAIIGEVTGEFDKNGASGASSDTYFAGKYRSLDVNIRDTILKKLKANAYKNVPGVALDYDAYLRASRSPEAYMASGLPISVVVSEGQEKVRVFLFPRNDFLGFYGSHYESEMREASGIVLLPEAVPVVLEVADRYARIQQIFRRFDSGAVYWLVLRDCNGLPDFSSWKKLSSVTLGNCKLSLDSIVKLHTSRVNQLNLLACDFSMEDLKNSHLLESLETFAYRPPNYKGGFRKLLSVVAATKHRLSRLRLSGDLEKDDIVFLQSMRSVSTLELLHAVLNDEKLVLLSQLQFVDELLVPDSELKSCSAQAVAKFKAALGAKLRGDEQIHLQF